MVVATICNHKGGTGKTTSALCLAAALGLSGRRVLLVDLDPQAFLSRTLGASDPPAEGSSLALFEEGARLEALQTSAMQGFDLLPSHGRLTRRMRRLNKPTDVLWIKEMIENSSTASRVREKEEQAKEGRYDTILFDTAAAVTVYSLNALVASRHALIPVTPEYQPVVGAEQTHQTTRMVQNRLNPALHAPHFLLTQVDGRKNTHARYQRYLRERYAGHVLGGTIRTSTAVTRTPKNGTTVFDHAPHARGARDYANAADEWLARMNAADRESKEGDGSAGRGDESRESRHARSRDRGSNDRGEAAPEAQGAPPPPEEEKQVGERPPEKDRTDGATPPSGEAHSGEAHSGEAHSGEAPAAAGDEEALSEEEVSSEEEGGAGEEQRAATPPPKKQAPPEEQAPPDGEPAAEKSASGEDASKVRKKEDAPRQPSRRASAAAGAPAARSPTTGPMD